MVCGAGNMARGAGVYVRAGQHCPRVLSDVHRATSGAQVLC